MPKFGSQSRRELISCDKRLQDILNEAIQYFDFSILCGHRSKSEQERLVRLGYSKTMKSKHLANPSLAVDLAPYPINWKDAPRFRYLAGWIMAVAADKRIPLRWGGDWDNDTDLHDQTFFDLGHFEIMD